MKKGRYRTANPVLPIESPFRIAYHVKGKAALVREKFGSA
jgi:hypothetical protein